MTIYTIGDQPFGTTAMYIISYLKATDIDDDYDFTAVVAISYSWDEIVFYQFHN